MPNNLAEKLTYGSSTMYYSFDTDSTRCVLLWGSNPVTSHLPMMWPDIAEAQRRGAKLVVIDPRTTRAAARADLHAALRPGTDLALALGLINVIIADGLYDRVFVERWVFGLDRLAERVAEYTPYRVSSITGVPADLIRRIAETYASYMPAYLEAGNALEHHSNSGQATRAVMILRALTGNIDVPGGHLLPQQLPLANLGLDGNASAARLLTAERHPLLADMAGFVPGDSLLASLLEGEPYPLSAMIMAGGNPLLTWPNTEMMRRGLRSLDLLVVMDLYMTETAKLADIVLPAADQFEKTQLIVRRGFFGRGNPTTYVALKKRIKDPGQRRSDWWFWNELAHRMEYDDLFPWSEVEEAIDFRLEPSGLSVQDLTEQPCGSFCGEPLRYRKYEEQGFPTPTGKVEFYSHVLDSYGHDPLPAYAEPVESPVETPDLAERFPLVLNAGRKIAVYTHSRHRNLPSLRAREPHPVAEIHPATAASYSIEDEDWILVESLRGRVEVRASVTDKICPGVVGLSHGWDQANANILTDHADCDPIVASPPLRSGLCRVRLKGVECEWRATLSQHND
jgi:anaerobic selenocysteine-containing dehydrogenase